MVDGRISTYSTKGRIDSDSITSLCEDREGTLWVGGENCGLTRIKQGTSTTYTTRDGLSTDIVIALHSDEQGTLWIGTMGGGLNRLKEGKFTVYTEKDGLFHDTVFQILEDSRENLWMGCNKGIFSVSKRELDQFADGKIRSISPKAYGVADGMKSSECNGGVHPGAWRDRAGRLWFTTVKGVVMVDPEHMKTNRLRPPVIVEQLVVDGQLVNQTSDIRLAPGAKNIEVHYTALSLLSPKGVRFKYMLLGSDDGWVDAGSRRVAYHMNIPPGQYKFRVIACNNDGLWNETGAELNLRLSPHFYQAYWFYGLAALSAVGMALGIHRLRVRRLEAGEKALSARVEEGLAHIKSLHGLLPICASCKRIRDDQGSWNQVEVYIRDHSQAEFSQGICPECATKLYPRFGNRGSDRISAD